MVTGYLDDRASRPWSDYFKGVLDLGVTLLASIFFCLDSARVAELAARPWAEVPQAFLAGQVMLWLPLVKGDFAMPVWGFLPLATVILWWTINATNCTDGVDGLAGSLTLLSLFFLALFLSVVVGHVEAARYLLVRHAADGPAWAILLTTAAGGLAGYLWHNAEPSRVLMGDAGSRFLGLLVGLAVLAAGNPFLVLVVSPVVLLNGGTGILKVALLRGFRRLGFDVRTPQQRQKAVAEQPGLALPEQHPLVSALHRVRFPLHDHCRKNLNWSNAQVLLRFLIIQAFLTPVLFGLLVKIR
jgi:phospho-N-acetylmuramoyl-pentapeptide-transferase